MKAAFNANNCNIRHNSLTNLCHASNGVRRHKLVGEAAGRAEELVLINRGVVEPRDAAAHVGCTAGTASQSGASSTPCRARSGGAPRPTTGNAPSLAARSPPDERARSLDI